jgi:hypothetical protein
MPAAPQRPELPRVHRSRAPLYEGLATVTSAGILLSSLTSADLSDRERCFIQVRGTASHVIVSATASLTVGVLLPAAESAVIPGILAYDDCVSCADLTLTAPLGNCVCYIRVD